VAIDPHFVSSLAQACAEYKTPNGVVKTEWNRKENIIELFVETSGEVKVSFSDRLICDNNVVIQKNGTFFENSSLTCRYTSSTKKSQPEN
jgi:hypothetical protein